MSFHTVQHDPDHAAENPVKSHTTVARVAKVAKVANIVETIDHGVGIAEKSLMVVVTIEETTDDMITEDVHAIAVKCHHSNPRNPSTARKQ